MSLYGSSSTKQRNEFVRGTKALSLRMQETRERVARRQLLGCRPEIIYAPATVTLQMLT